MVIDDCIHTNLVNTMVKKLNLTTFQHPRLYKMGWLNDSGAVKVNKKVLVPFLIEKYNDKVLCDVIPMHYGHISLGEVVAI